MDNVRNNWLRPPLRLGFLLALLVPVMGGGSSTLSAQSGPSCPVPATLTEGFAGPMAHVRYLADDALEGREAATRGARCAGDYIAAYFADLGLTGVGPDGSFFQSFEIRAGSKLEDGNSLTVGGQALELGTDWSPFAFSASAAVEAALAYGGTGVSQPGTDEDAYAHIPLDGKIIVLEGGDPHSEDSSVMGSAHFKATVGAGRDAAAVIILLAEGAELPDVADARFPDVSVPVVGISGDLADEIRTKAQAETQVSLTTAVSPRNMEARNVVALLPGSDPDLRDEVMVIGAHYDHLGFGGSGSLDPDASAIHNGADDNASGTAALMEVARMMAEGETQPARSVLFMAFTAEEKGLWGAAHYVRDPLLPLENTVAMINMDMVGRLRDNTLTVMGTGTADLWPAIIERANQGQGEPFSITSIPDGRGASDHNEFFNADVPVLMLFTNTHAEYHRPEDDWNLINAEGLERVSRFAADLAGEVAGVAPHAAPVLAFVEAEEEPQEMGPTRSSPAGGVYMGGIPDMTPQDFGVRITGTRAGSPADKAGLVEGDIIVEFGGKEISDLYAYTYALRDHQPGDEVVIVVLRDGERVSLTAVLGRRGG